jgi:hypothetical protein
VATRFHFLTTASSETTPTAEQSTAFPVGTNNSLAFSRKKMTVTAGNANGNTTQNTLAQTTQQSGNHLTFISDALAAQTIAAATWKIGLGAFESNNAANVFLGVALYIWRPSTAAKVATIYDNSTALGTEFPATPSAIVTTFSGSSVTIQDGDVLVCELWYVATQSMATAYNLQSFYGGPDVIAVTGDGWLNPPDSFLENPNTISFYSAGSVSAAVTDANPAESDSATATHVTQHTASVTDSNPAEIDSATTALSNIPNFDASVTDTNSAETESVTSTQTVFHTAAVTDSNNAEVDSATAIETTSHSASVTDANPAEGDSSTVTHTPTQISASVTDSNAAEGQTVTATHTAPVINASVTDSNTGEVDTVTANETATNISASVTDANSAEVDSATVSQKVFHTAAVTDLNPAEGGSVTVSQAVPNFNAVVTDNNAAEIDSSSATLVPPNIQAVVSDSNSSEVDSVTASHIPSIPEDAVVTDINGLVSEYVTVLHTPFVEPVDHQWDGKTIPTLNVTIAYHVYTGVGYLVRKIFRFNPNPPKRYQYACAVQNINTGVGGRADVWWDEVALMWRCGEYKAVTSRDVDGVLKSL